MTKGFLFKLFAILFVLGVVLIVGSGTFIYLSLDNLAKKAITQTLTYVLQVNVTLDKVDVRLKDGAIDLTGLVIPNPDGFNRPTAMRLDRVSIAVDPASLRTDAINMRLIAVDGPQITLEQGMGGSNIKQLIKNASRFSQDDTTSPADSGKNTPNAEKTITIHTVRFTNTQVNLASPVLGKDLAFTVPLIEVKDIGRSGERVAVAQAVQYLLNRILVAALQQGQTLAPADLISTLSDGVRGADALIQQNGSNMQQRLKENVGGLRDNLKGIFGPRNQPPQP